MYREQDVLVLEGCRLVVPEYKHDAILSLLHSGRSGRDIERSVANCAPCQAQRQSNPRPKMNDVNLPGDAKQPMLHTACDLFSAVGRQWLALVDKFSGYGLATPLRKLDTRGVTQHLENWFYEFGWPTHIHTDGGPQFCLELKDFCAWHGIQHELSSPTTLRVTVWPKQQ